ncbi:MAG: SMP-30/gluconolactonase/LRE family protein [Hyphomicrobiales bacterium]|nr:MAG: SMP-30/gluconolactonase/LRE family protein [Hyphomicrobiales bacterium]
MSDKAELFIDSRCELGEGPFWHPLQERLFWFDILNKTLFSATAGGIMVDRFTFDATVSAAGVIDADNLAIAAIQGIYKLQISTDTREIITPLDPENTTTRTNDGRVNPAGGLWIGTMDLKDAGSNASGKLYQVRAGQVTKLLDDQHIPNATCFSPDGRRAYYTDTSTGIIRTVETDPETGLPRGEWREFVGKGHPGHPDGAVVDAEGFVWNARWDGSCVIRFAPDGRVDRIVKTEASRPTCPAFGGKDLKTMYITSSRANLSAEQLAIEPGAGGVFAIDVDVPGQPENLFRA